MERKIAEILRECAAQLSDLRLEAVLSQGEDGGAYLLHGQGADYVLKYAVGARAGMLDGEWRALESLARLAPGSVPEPLLTGGDGESKWLLRRYVAGQTLNEYVDARGRIPTQEALKEARALVALIGRIHGAGLICRDVKPENLVRTEDGRWLLIDAGTVRRPEKDKARDTALYVTHGFAAPEQYGFRQSDKRADVYALGVTLCYLFTQSTRPEALKRRGVPLRVRRVISKCMAFAPEDRYADTDAVARGLRAVRAPMAAALALVLVCAGLAGFYFGSRNGPQEVSSYEALIQALNAAPEGSAVEICIEGRFEAEDTIPIWHRKVTFCGDGVIVGAHPEKATLRVHPESEFILTDSVRIENHREGMCVAVQGGSFTMRGGALMREPESDETDVNAALYVMDDARVEIQAGEIRSRRDRGVAIAIQGTDSCDIHFSGGRAEAMGNSCIVVLMSGTSKFTMSGGVISGISRDEAGYTVNDMDLAEIRYEGGEMLVNGLTETPLEEANAVVGNYDDLVKAISARAELIVVDGTIYVPQPIRVNGERRFSLVGKDENARIVVEESEHLFYISEDSGVALRNLSLEGGAGIDNHGRLEMQKIRFKPRGRYGYIMNYGELKLLYDNEVEVGPRCFLNNRKGATAIVTANIVAGGNQAIVNEGELLLKKSRIDMTSEEGVWVENLQGAQYEAERSTFLRNGVEEDF